jgi:hypothetical protein
MPRDKSGEPLSILACEPTERLATVFDRADRIGRHVAVVVPTSRKTLCVFTLSRTATTMKPGSHPDDCMLHPDTEIGMLLVYLREVKPVARCHMVSPTRKVELIEDGLARC